MAVDEGAGHRLFLKLEEVLGPEAAGVLMEHLPPVSWPDVATKQDIEGLRVTTKQDIEGLRVATKQDIAVLEAKMEAMEHRILGTMRQEMARNTATFVRTTVLGNAAAILAVAGIAFGAARLH